jgi:hypothetical protein
MKSLEQEALEYADGNENNSLTINSFIAGANSKHVQAEIIKAQIDFLENEMVGISYDIREIYIDELKQQLKELEQ